MSGDFTVVNAPLVRDLKARGLWDEVMVADLKYFDGSVGADRPHPRRSQGALCHRLRDRPAWLIEAAARRQKWIDQAQSLNLYHRQSVRQEARRALSPGLEARAEDHLLPALAQRDPCREIDAEGHRRQAQRVSRRPHRCRQRASMLRGADRCCSIDDPDLRSLPVRARSTGEHRTCSTGPNRPARRSAVAAAGAFAADRRLPMPTGLGAIDRRGGRVSRRRQAR